MVAGTLQLAFGLLRFCGIGAFIPTGVIKGKLAAIGLLLIGTQVPLALGHTADTEAALTAPTSLLEGISPLVEGIAPLAFVITLLGLAVLAGFETRFVQRRAWLRIIPAPLIVVGLGMIISAIASATGSSLALGANQHIELPGLDGPVALVGALQPPDFSQWLTPQIDVVGITIALIASLETLLSVEAIDELDPLGRTSPAHRELGAQGIGNMISGLVGGLPMTAVTVRSSANVQAGGRTRLASFVHGVLLTKSVAFAASAL